jgi:hypothetical protein
MALCSQPARPQKLLRGCTGRRAPAGGEQVMHSAESAVAQGYGIDSGMRSMALRGIHACWAHVDLRLACWQTG